MKEELGEQTALVAWNGAKFTGRVLWEMLAEALERMQTETLARPFDDNIGQKKEADKKQGVEDRGQTKEGVEAPTGVSETQFTPVRVREAALQDLAKQLKTQGTSLGFYQEIKSGHYVAIFKAKSEVELRKGVTFGQTYLGQVLKRESLQQKIIKARGKMSKREVAKGKGKIRQPKRAVKKAISLKR